MLIKNRIVRGIACAVLCMTALYSGISCFATLRRANTQAYLLSGTERFDFCGYYMMAGVCATVCLSAVSVLLLSAVLARKSRRDIQQSK